MKEWFRRIFSILAAGSVLLCAATIVLWVTTLRSTRYFELSPGHHLISMHAGSGQVDCSYFPSIDSRMRWSGWSGSSSEARRIAGVNDRHRQQAWWFGFDWDTNTDLRPGLGRPHIIVSDWLLCLVSMLPAVPWLVQNRKRVRATAACCRHCGYDLRATPDRCPECGLVATSTKAKCSGAPPEEARDRCNLHTGC